MADSYWHRVVPLMRANSAATASPLTLGTSGDTLRAVLILAALAIASRAEFFGNPILDSDEGFYLLVGQRMLHGAVPYVDIWDRKPVGLFLLYAAMRALGGDGVLAYQLVGTVFAFATALLITLLARQFTNLFGAVAAGAAYLIWLTLGSAAGGQAELFYSLPVCAAALITMRGMQAAAPLRVGPRGAIAMLLIGIAAQIKYNALFEGIFFGCCWLVIAWRAGGRAMLGLYAILWILAAVLPTLLAGSWYAAHGQLDSFLFANFQSIWHRGSSSFLGLLQRLTDMAVIVVPLLACARSPSRVGNGPAAVPYRFTLCWLAASIVSVLAFGTYLEQYLLPILVPASAAAGLFFGGGSGRRAVTVLAVAGLLGQAKLCVTQLVQGSRRELVQITQHIDPSRCLYVYSGLSAIYRISGACIPTRFAFPSHLSRAREANAIGVDPVQEVDRVMYTLPGTVIVRSPYSGDENWAARDVLFRHLHHDYQRVFLGKLGWQTVEVYRLTKAANQDSAHVPGSSSDVSADCHTPAPTSQSVRQTDEAAVTKDLKLVERMLARTGRESGECWTARQAGAHVVAADLARSDAQ